MSVHRLLLAAVALAAISPSAAAAREVVLEARDDGGAFRFEGGGTNPVLTAQPGESLTVRLVNRGSTGHNWELSGGTPGLDFPLAPGNASAVTFDAPAEGDHAYVCLAHEAQGMRGILRVEKAGLPLHAGLAILAILAAVVLLRARA